MGNYAYLYRAHPGGNPYDGRDTQLYAAKYFVPLLWVACLKSGELKRGVDQEDPDDETFYFMLSAAEAASRCSARAEFLEGLVPNIADYLPDWVGVLRGLGPDVLKIDVTEIVLMTQPTLGHLEAALGFFDNPTQEGAAGLFAITCLPDVLDPETGRAQDRDRHTSASYYMTVKGRVN